MAQTAKARGRPVHYWAAAELRDLDVAGPGPFTHLEGRAVPYNTWADIGWFLEEHAADSLKQSTTARTGKGLPLLLFHDNRTLAHHIGRAAEWRSNGDGLHGVWELNDRPEAQIAARMAKDGELGYLSIGFSPVRSDWDYAETWDPEAGPDFMDRVTRKESRLLEVSVVSTPAFVDAEVTAVRSASGRFQPPELLEALRRLSAEQRVEFFEASERLRAAPGLAALMGQGRAGAGSTSPARPRLEEWKHRRAALER